MPSGGAREGAGRPVGSRNTRMSRTRIIATQLLHEENSPLEVMVKTMKAFLAMAGKADDEKMKMHWMVQAHGAAKDAAPYIHPKLASVEHSVEPEDSDQTLMQVTPTLLREIDAKFDAEF